MRYEIEAVFVQPTGDRVVGRVPLQLDDASWKPVIPDTIVADEHPSGRRLGEWNLSPGLDDGRPRYLWTPTA